jgi:transposase
VIVPPDLAGLSHAEKDALILALFAQLAEAHEKIAALEARIGELTRPPKTPGNSSKPPSQGQKQDTPAAGVDHPPRKSRPGTGRALHPNPDRTIERRLANCPKCEAVFPEASQTPQQVYDRIELPPVRPDVTRVRLFGGRCPCCGERATAEAPAGLEPGSPFGPSIAAMVVYRHDAHAIGMERLALLMDELFGWPSARTRSAMSWLERANLHWTRRRRSSRWCWPVRWCAPTKPPSGSKARLGGDGSSSTRSRCCMRSNPAVARRW